MSDIVKRLRDRRLSVWEESKAIASRSADENRNMSPEEQGQWDGLMSEMDALDTRIKSALDVEQRSKETNDLFNRIAAQPAQNGAGEYNPAKSAAELRAWMRGAGRGNAGDGSNAFIVKQEGTYEQRVLS